MPIACGLYLQEMQPTNWPPRPGRFLDLALGAVAEEAKVAEDAPRATGQLIRTSGSFHSGS